ncbi:hypothetical protein FRC02_003932 [Tulasnella sp. 418]|nr:hypothetical protein FRC02_003932 [Tulasnella sp. 418]
MGDSCYVMSEDISAPAHIPGEPLRVPKLDPMAGTTTTNEVPYSRNNYITFTPAQSFETFLVQLGGAWTAIRHPLSGVVVDGFEFAIGTDIIVRVGQVRQAAVHKGMLIEAELVPLPTSPNSATPAILSELLLSLPPLNSEIQSVSLTDQQWEEVIYEDDDDPSNVSAAKPIAMESGEDSDLFNYRGEEGKAEPRDWTGAQRDKRMAFLILRLLVMEKSI